MARKGTSMENKITTREKIVIESLRLFAGKGYDGVSMREIAAAVGIKGASIYNHFKGKEDIFLAIFEEMTKRYGHIATMLQMPEEQGEEAAEYYMEADEDKLLHMAEELFSFFARDEFAMLFRKLLASEQHKSSLAAKYFRSYYLEAPVIFQTQVFAGMQKKGAFQNFDAETMALHFYSPIYYLLSRFDAGYSYEECIEQLHKHVHWFCVLYH
ncbi:TetR/AcrR family transcriptional regulator [Roseburia sp. 499]|uniref:TetR/AcrR family transcriptional regulator n=1 Tax=Roseburia sp. 499 TaxID=1261634 RepID=UPI0009F9C350|nr:TetR/AcrR family transcriptional regulator [Roseburia sp. 499]WVK70305.1 TetR/AcrR family transcriptional regulator [Roseburia sp. 499]